MSSINLVSINQIDWSSPSLQRLLSSTSTLSKCLISIVISINLSIIVANETTTTTTATIRSIFDQSTGRIYLENGMEVINNNSQLPSNTFRTILLQSQPTTTSIPFNNNNDNKNVDNVDKSSKSQISVHIYLIFFIGFVPACVVGALAWCGMNDRLLQCCKNPQHQNKQCDYEYNNHHDHHRHYHSRHCHHIDHETNENFNHKHSNHHHHHGQSNNHHHRQQMIDYNNNNHRKTNEILQSRPIHSTYEVPRNSFEMLEILGEGNFGQVWKAKSYYFNNNHGHNHQQYNDYLNKKQQFVAVKTNKLNDNDEHQDDLLKELDIMVQLGSHPNVVRLLGCCTENKPYYIVMEYVSKGKLLSYLRKHRNDYLDIMNYNDINNGNNNNNSSSTLIMSNTNTNHDHNNNNRPSINNDNYMTYHNHRNNDGYGQINGTKSIINNGKIKNNFYENNNNQSILTSYDLIQFAYQICKGMEFISSHGIIHRDLAIRNILIDEHKNCKVADFGLSRSIRDKDCDLYEMKHGGQVPVRWMSPEALTMGIFSIKSDVWAFGITLWEIVTLGSTPYIGMNASEVINFIRQGNICPQPEHCNDHLYDLMKSCWAYKADDRFTFTQIKYQLMKMLLAMQENQNNNDNNYIDLDNFNNSLYYFNTTDPSDEKL